MDKTVIVPVFLTGEVPEQTLPTEKMAELTEVTATLIKYASAYREKVGSGPAGRASGPVMQRTPQEMMFIAKMFKQTIDSWYTDENEG